MSAVETAEITVQYVNPPKEGKKWGSIKSTVGDSYYGPPSMLSRYRPGETCKIEFGFSEDGKFKNLKQKIDVPQALQRAVPAAPRAPTNPIDGERMGTMGMVNGFISSGQVTLHRDAIKSAIKTCRDAYNDEWGNPKKQMTEAEFNDEIPI